MKHFCMLLVLLLTLSVLAACSKQESKQPVDTGAAQETKAVETEATPSPSPKEEEPVVIEEENPLAQRLKEALGKTMTLQSIDYVASNHEITQFEYRDGGEGISETGIYSTYAGTLNREPSRAKVDLNRLIVYSELSSDYTPQSSEDEELEISYYLVKDEGQYSYTVEDNVWQKDVLSDQFKTIEHIEDLVSFFISHPDQLIETEYGDNASIDLNLSAEQFSEFSQLLEYTFFNGWFEPVLPDHMGELAPELLEYQYVSLILDNSNNVVGYYFSYGQKTDIDFLGDYYSSYFLVEFTNHNSAATIVVPDEVIESAIAW